MRPYDASDLLSPILLKELRQGLKSRAFGALFLLMTATLVIGAAVCVIGTNQRHNADELSAIFWACAGVPLILLALPAFVAIRSEFKRHTYELLLVTTLTPWRIVFGKWLSIALQAVLVASLALPFVILRYFLGGVELVDDTRFLSGLVGASFLLAATGITLTCGFKIGLDRLLRIGCIGILSLPFLACFAGMAFSLLGWLLTANSLAAVNGALLSLLVLNRGARELSPESEQPELLQSRGAFWFLCAATLCSQCAARWPLAYLGSMVLVYLAVMLFLDTNATVPLFVTTALPQEAQHLGREAVSAAFVLAHVAWMLCHPLPAPPLLVLTALAGTIAFPWMLMELMDRWVGESRATFMASCQCILVGAACAHFPDVVYGFLPPAALALCLHGSANPAWQMPLLATTLASGSLLAYLLYRRINAVQNGDDASRA